LQTDAHAQPKALAVVQAAISLSRTHRYAPKLDVLDLVMKGRIDQVLDFTEPTTPQRSLAAPGAPFGQLLAAAFDEAMTPPALAVLAHPAAELVGVDPALARQSRYRRAGPAARSHQLGIGRLVVHTAPVALATDHKSAGQLFHTVWHHVPTFSYVGT
jgi:hypothetical protein